MADLNTAHRLLVHCFGGDKPYVGDLPMTMVLLRTGRFPEGWVGTYTELVNEAIREYQHLPAWPRELLAATYVASVYCPKRYADWLELGGAKQPDTERDLLKVRWASDSLMFGWFYRASGEQSAQST